MPKVRTARSMADLRGALKYADKIRVDGVLHGRFNRVCNDMTISINSLSRIFDHIEGGVRFIEDGSTLRILSNSSADKRKQAIAPKNSNGKARNYRNIFDEIVKYTEVDSEKKRHENFELSSREEVYCSLINPVFLRDIRERIQEEFAQTELYTGDDLEACIGDIAENEKLYDTSIDKAILSIALTKEHVSQLKQDGKREEARKMGNYLEYIIAASLLQDYSIRNLPDAEKQRGRAHGKKSSDELKGRVLDHVRGGVLHHENHIEEKAKRWSALPPYSRLVALSNNAYNSARHGQFRPRASRFGKEIQVDYPAFMKALSSADPGKCVDALTNAAFEYETLLRKTGEDIKKNLKEYMQKKIKDNLIHIIEDSSVKVKVEKAFDIYCNNRAAKLY